MNIARTRSKAIGSALILIVGVLNFHVPHFLLERSSQPAESLPALELVFGANVLGAVVAALAIWGTRLWGWALGGLVVALSILLYVAQETLGLPGLPRSWLEPSRIVALIFDALFVLVATRVYKRHVAEQVSRRDSGLRSIT